ncbi:CDGSH iron-sulfur domain-containing protein NEET [Humulus lupulus]|uniref:CDGSH iron-sulfur domain-containing protein NEET n=1 Tax=Humulus lupulus TaxID=3486 RepID=UPI002B41300D|nr:CDGSH iron-sulfur domain-containing protein NEET [Humulus lupulus]
MASNVVTLTTTTVGLVSSGKSCTLKPAVPFPSLSFSNSNARPRITVVRATEAAAQAINPEIRKTEAKVVDSVVVSELSKPLTPYCRCWRSGTFPLCDGSHVKHNKATGDNVGPLLLKKE